ncbi:MAG: hypothetical protein NC308_09330 [Clostridium sp.]|nr:hypothetical protein [Bacteroides sp.]MCM1199078.1 hypothetical protein [Clostridium sp.]
MRNLCLLIAVIVFPAVAIAQNYDSYLQEAKEHLEQGNVESAKKSYQVYRRLTDKTDAMFEELLKEYGQNTLWMRSCRIFDLNDSTFIAVQALDMTSVSHYLDAKIKAESSRLGGFDDWRLPDQGEMTCIMSNLPSDEQNAPFYWIASCYRSASASQTVIINGRIEPISESFNEEIYKVLDKCTGVKDVYGRSVKTKNGVVVSDTEFGDKAYCAWYFIVRTFPKNDKQF